MPIINGIVKNNGLYYKIKNADSQFYAHKTIKFSFDFLNGDFSDIDPLFTMNTDNYTFYCGEGSWGRDGFIYIENSDTKELFWCFFGDYNPIEKCALSGNVLIAENNNNRKYIFDFYNPEKVYCER